MLVGRQPRCQFETRLELKIMFETRETRGFDFETGVSPTPVAPRARRDDDGLSILYFTYLSPDREERGPDAYFFIKSSMIE